MPFVNQAGRQVDTALPAPEDATQNMESDNSKKVNPFNLKIKSKEDVIQVDAQSTGFSSMVVRSPVVQDRRTFLTSRELAAYLRVSLSTIRNRVKEGSIPFAKVYGKLLFDLAEINAWVTDQREMDRMVRRATANKANRRQRHQTSELPVVFTLD